MTTAIFFTNDVLGTVPPKFSEFLFALEFLSLLTRNYVFLVLIGCLFSLSIQ